MVNYANSLTSLHLAMCKNIPLDLLNQLHVLKNLTLICGEKVRNKVKIHLPELVNMTIRIGTTNTHRLFISYLDSHVNYSIKCPKLEHIKVDYWGFGVNTSVKCPNAHISSFHCLHRKYVNDKPEEQLGTLKMHVKSFDAFLPKIKLSRFELYVTEPIKRFRVLVDAQVYWSPVLYFN